MYIRLRYSGTRSVLRGFYRQTLSKFCVLGRNLRVNSDNVVSVTRSLILESGFLYEMNHRGFISVALMGAT
jgi:hypothetical protein